MAIDNNRAAMLGKRAELQDQIKRLLWQVESCCDGISGALNHLLTPVVEMEIPKAAAEMDQLVRIWAELLSARADLDKLNRALGCS